MLVQVWVRATLIKAPDGGDAGGFRQITQWTDNESATPRLAAERVWRVCSSGALDLTPVELKWQEQWRAHRHGYGFGVGDVAVVDGSAYRCEPRGFVPTTTPV
jgi:hypothetical protein